MASSIEATEEETHALHMGEEIDEVNESSLSRRARFNEQPVEKSGWIEVCQSEPQVVTFTGVVRTGQTPGQQVQVQLEMTEDELTKLNQSTEGDDGDKDRKCVLNRLCGPHILCFSFLFMPLSFITSFCISFYLGTLTWYNSIVYFSEERRVWHKLFICPVLILTFPFTVVLSACFLGIYACLVQLSWFWKHWWREIRDFEKGFYGWLCNKLDLSQCSPYDIVVLNESVDVNALDD